MPHHNQLVKEQTQRQQIMGAGNKGLEKRRQLRSRHAPQAQLGGFDMGDVKQGGIGRKGRYGSGLDDLHVRHVDIFGNDKGGRAHDRRSQLPVRAGGHLDRGGLFGRIADFFHQRNGKRAGGDDVGNTGAGHQTGQTAAHNGRLGRSALKPPQQGQGQLNEILTGAGFVQHGAEKHKQKNDGGRYVQGNAVDALGGHGHLPHEAIQRNPLEGNQLRHIGAEKGIDDEKASQ